MRAAASWAAGNPLPDNLLGGAHGFTKLVMCSTGPAIVRYLDAPTKDECRLHFEGRAGLGLTRTVNLLGMMYRMEGVTQGWEFLTYAPAHDPEGTRRLLERSLDVDWSVAIALVDSNTGLFCGRRRHALSKPFATILADALLSLEDNLPYFSDALYQQEITGADRMWSTQDDMLAAMRIMRDGRRIEDLSD